MVTAKIDIDNDDPYLLARELFTIGNYECAIRMSSNKGTHIKIFDVSDSCAFSIKTRLDDLYRVALDESRSKYAPSCTNVLWDSKNGKFSSVWVHCKTRWLAFYLLKSSSRSLRDAIEHLHTTSIMQEYV